MGSLNIDAVDGLFTAAGVPARLSGIAVAHLGEAAAEALRENPWRLLELPGVGPEQTDHFARAVLAGRATAADPRRAVSLVTYLLLRAARDGHTAARADLVVSALRAYDLTDPVGAVRAALDEAKAVAFLDEAGGGDDDDAAPAELLSLAPQAMAEDSLAEGLARLLATARPLPDDERHDTDAAVTTAMTHGVSVVAASRGAGRRVMAALAGTSGVRVALATATEAAAATVATTWRTSVSSVHRLLEPLDGPGPVQYGRGERWPVEADLVVVTDAEVLDVVRAAALVEACPDGAHLVLVGDPAAMPSHGPGRVLGDVIESGAVPVTRPGAPSPTAIEDLATAVRDGEVPPVDSPDRTVVVVPAGEGREATHRAVQLVTDSIPRALSIAASEVQVLAPVRRGAAGTLALNRAVQAKLSPGEGLGPGDRVVTTVDLPEVAAGEIGTVSGGDAGGYEVDFASETAAVPAFALRPGWAVEVGRAGGVDRPAVVAVLPGEAAGTLSRPLVYTAFTRASRHLSVVHAAGADLARAVRDVPGPPRRTRLGALLRETVAAVNA